MLNFDMLSLQDGNGFITSDGIKFRHPKITDISKLTEDIYIWWMFSWVRNKYDLIHQLWINNVDFENITNDEIIIGAVESNPKLFIDILMYFTNIIGAELKYNQEYEMNLIYYNTKENLSLRPILPNIMDEIALFIRTIHEFKNSERRIFASQSDKKRILDNEVEDLKFNEKFNRNKLGYVSTMRRALVIYNKRTWEYTSSLFIYQLITEFNGINKLEDSNRLYNGIYSGTVNYDKINKKMLDWINN